MIHQSNAGLSAARNAGLDSAVGMWIAFIDGDDWIVPAFVETLMPYLNESLDIILFPFFNVRDSSVTDGFAYSRKVHYLNQNDFEQILMNLIDTGKRIRDVSGGCATAWSKVYRHGFVEENHLRFDTEAGLHEDVVFNLYAFSCAKAVLYVPVPLYFYLRRDDSLSNHYGVDQVEKYMDAMYSIGRFVEAAGPQYRNLYQKRILVCLVRMCVLCYCHRDNPDSYRQRRAAFLKKRDSEPFRSALNLRTITSFSFQKQVCMWLIKLRMFGLLNLIFGKTKL